MAFAFRGVEGISVQREVDITETIAPVPAAAPEPRSTSSRPHRATSYHNPFQTSCSVSHDEPPAYAHAIRARPKERSLEEGCERLPGYSCTVSAEARLSLFLESAEPFSTSDSQWIEIYAVLRGPLLRLHRLRNGGAGKLCKAYTLQHAEVGLAPDAQHTILVPRSRIAALVPQSARRRAHRRDPNMYQEVRQTILRLRVEDQQLLLADSDEERIFSLIRALSASIDISMAIEERSIPRQCTVPRRRRRQQHQPRQYSDLNDPELLAEQERIYRQMFPHLAPDETDTQTESQRPVSPDAQTQPTQNLAREEEEIDFSMIREENSSYLPARARTNSESVRPTPSRQDTSASTNSAFEDSMIYATPVTNFNADGKWQPPHNRTAAQVQRYIRRCMPILLFDAERASDIIIMDGRRMKINKRMQVFEPWELQPPSYKAHKFDNHDNSNDASISTSTSLIRANSQRSTTLNNEPQSSSSVLAAEDDQIAEAAQIEQQSIEQSLEGLQLSKVISTTTATDKRCSPSHTTLQAMASMDPKGRSPAQLAREIHGVVFCF